MVRHSVEREANGLAITLFEKEDILSNFVSLEISPTKAFSVGINIIWSLYCSNNPNSKNM